MKTSEAVQNHNQCPACYGPVSADRKGKGFVRHLVPCTRTPAYGTGERDVNPGRV